MARRDPTMIPRPRPNGIDPRDSVGALSAVLNEARGLVKEKDRQLRRAAGRHAALQGELGAALEATAAGAYTRPPASST